MLAIAVPINSFENQFTSSLFKQRKPQTITQTINLLYHSLNIPTSASSFL